MKELREYQINILESIKKDIKDGVKNIVMAMCPNAGKTFTTIKLLEDLIEEGQVKKALILAHGTTVLRDQFYQSLININPSFTISSISPESKDVSGQVVVAIPQGLDRIDLSQFDFLVVDEAHERFLAKQGQELAKKVNAKSNLLLTGTPSKFIYKNIKKEQYKIHMVAMSDIPNEFMANSQIFICSSKYTFKDSDYNEKEDLRYGTKFKKSETEESLDELAQQMIRILKMKSISSLDNLFPIAFGKLEKTMFVCKRQSQALHVFSYLNKKGVKVIVSTENNDKDSQNIQKFIEDKDIKVLIVVSRGILGFNLPSLVNVVDMSGTRNLDRMYQMFSRITRVHDGYPIKRYFKIAPVGEVEYVQYVTSAMLSLIHRTNIELYNGNNFKTVLPILTKKRVVYNKSSSTEKKSKLPSSQKMVEFEGLDIVLNFSKLYSNMDKTLQVYSRTNLQEVMVSLRKYDSQLPSKWWNEYRVYQCSKNYRSLSTFKKGSASAYKAARRLNIIYSVCKVNNWSLNANKKEVVCIETNEVFDSIAEASKKMKIGKVCISTVCRGKQKTAGGYTFKYVEEDE